MNSADRSLSHQKLESLIRDVVGHSLDGWLSKYVKSSRTPDIPKDEDLFSGGTIPRPESEPEPEDDEEDEEGTGPDDEIDECPVCGEFVTGDQQFCEACGTALFRQCPVCGAVSRTNPTVQNVAQQSKRNVRSAELEDIPQRNSVPAAVRGFSKSTQDVLL